MVTNEHISIIGSGLCGSLLALYLAKRGFTVDIFERRKDMRKFNISAGRSINLALANRGIHALSQVGIMEKIKPHLIPMKGRMLHDEDGKQEFLRYGMRDSEVIYSISRAKLNKLLMDEAQATKLVNFHFNASLESVDFSQSLMSLNSDDGTTSTVPFQRIIGTDGFASQLRGILNKLYQAQGIDHQFVGEPLDHSYKELTIPAKGNQFALDPYALHIWPRGDYMLIALPNMDKSFTVTLFMPNLGSESFSTINNAEQLRTFFTKRFPDVIDLIPQLEQDFFNNPTGKLSTVRATPWFYQDKALIIGDAAHAIVPFHGQGMNCAFEDCSDFNAVLDSSDNWQQVFMEVERIRKPNADAIADMALENYVEMRASVMDHHFQLKKQLSFELEKRFPDVFIPRYSMVMFHRIPYAKAKAYGVIQDDILEQLTQNIETVEQVDFQLAQQLIEQKIGLSSILLA